MLRIGVYFSSGYPIVGDPAAQSHPLVAPVRVNVVNGPSMGPGPPVRDNVDNVAQTAPIRCGVCFPFITWDGNNGHLMSDN